MQISSHCMKLKSITLPSLYQIFEPGKWNTINADKYTTSAKFTNLTFFVIPVY